jgi:hypothetical protein
VLNCDKSGSKGHQGHVSAFYQPTRHESGSYVQISNLFYKDNKGNSILYNSCFRDQIHDHFKHTSSSIGPTGAELEAFQILTLYDAIDKDTDKELAAAKCSLVFEKKVFNSLPKMAAPVPVPTLVSSFYYQEYKY